MIKKKINPTDNQTLNQYFLEKAVETLHALVSWKYECAIEEVAEGLWSGSFLLPGRECYEKGK